MEPRANKICSRVINMKIKRVEFAELWLQKHYAEEEALGLLCLLWGSSGPLLLQRCEWFV